VCVTGSAPDRARSRRISPFTGRTSPASAGCSDALHAPAATTTVSASSVPPANRTRPVSTDSARRESNATPAPRAADTKADNNSRLSTARSPGTKSPLRTLGPSDGSRARTAAPSSTSTGLPSEPRWVASVASTAASAASTATATVPAVSSGTPSAEA
jgi:hypothetical protein